ncbi:MAG: peptidoglycan-binding protein [Candidatus Spechtbacterales bacterium]|nr:peptidoglycan-binding protein [Candidatus Spechtbacterales bacterium]
MWRVIVARILILLFIGLAIFDVLSSNDSAEAYEISCPQSDYRHFTFDFADFKKGWEDEFMEVAKRWNNYANVFVGSNNENAVTVKVAYTKNVINAHKNNLGYATCGLASTPFIVINANYVKDVELMKLVAVHEVGHIIGLAHTDVEKASMYYKINSRPFPHTDDIAGLRHLYGMHPKGDLKGWASKYNCGNKKPNLRMGSHGECVKELQERLNMRGYNLKEDGTYGIKTAQAVIWFQDSRDLYVDGIVGKETWSALWQKPKPKPPPTPKPSPSNTPEPEVAPEPEIKPEPEVAPETKVTVEPEPKAKSKSKITPEPEPEVKPEPTPSPKPEIQENAEDTRSFIEKFLDWLKDLFK